jgi:hypothetical protein
MDIAFDEPTGASEQGFGFDAPSGTADGMGFGESAGLGDDLGLGNFGIATAPVAFDAPAPAAFDAPVLDAFVAPVAPSFSPPAPVAAAPAPSSMFAAPEAENPLTIWEAQHKIDLKEKAEKEKINNDKMRKDADAWLKQFSEERKKNHDTKHKDNKYVMRCCLFSFLTVMIICVYIRCISMKKSHKPFLTNFRLGQMNRHLRKRWRKSIRPAQLGLA